MKTDSNDDAADHGTAEETSLTVKCLGEDWIVENGLGETVASAKDRDGAVQKAREVAAEQHASGISVLDADAAVQKSLTA